MANDEDPVLVHRAVQGDAMAFRALVEKYESWIFDLCFRVTRNEEDAEDLAQETFKALYQNLPRYKSAHKVSNWIYTIALNKCRSFIRRKKVIRFLSLDWVMPGSAESLGGTLPSRGPSPDKVFSQRRRLEDLSRFLDEMPEARSLPIILKYLHGLEDEDAAKILGISLGNFRVRLHRGRAELMAKRKGWGMDL